MSLSESQRELLLSASLDGALSPEEQVMLDQWLREDPAAVKRRDELVEMNDQLRAALAPARQAKLGEDFAERVIQAAMAQAQHEGLSPRHPLVRLAQQAEGEATAGQSAARWGWRGSAAAVALAACVLLAIYIGRPAGDLGADRPQDLAQVDRPDHQGPVAQPRIAERRPTSPPDTTPDDPAGTTAPDALAVQPGRGPAVPEMDRAPLPSSTAPTAADVAASKGTPGEIAAGRMPAGAPTAERRADAEDPEAMPLVAVLVVSVEMTPAGRDSLALHEALRESDIQLGPAGAVNEQVVNHLRQSEIIQTPEGESDGKLYYIEAPAKQLDRFLLRLMAEKDSFASFGFSIANHPPLLASVNQWRVVDPIQLRHADSGAMARDLVAADGAPLVIDQGPALIPMPREMGTAGLLAPAATTSDTQSPTGDIISQILLLVH